MPTMKVLCTTFLVAALLAPFGLRLATAPLPTSAGRALQPTLGSPIDGPTLYASHCSVCHGPKGAGDGPASYLLRPQPRNFRLGLFRLVSTENAVPTRADILKTLREGMPGTGMPAWSHLPEVQLEALAGHVLDLSRRGVAEELLAWAEEEDEEMSEEEAREIAENQMTPGEAIHVPSGTSNTPEDVTRGRFLFAKHCATCHGTTGRGMTNPEWRTAEGYPIRSRDLLDGVFKGGRDGMSLYHRLYAGLPGSPMPGFKQVPETELWSIVHYVQSLSNPMSQEMSRVRQVEMRAVRVDRLPEGPDDHDVWSAVPPYRVTLMPLFLRNEFRDAVLVRAAHDGKRIAFLVQWQDPTRDVGGLGQTEFPDACALQHSDAAEAPLFTMGDPEHRVNIWHWKALWSEDAIAFQDVDSLWPNAVADGYFGQENGWKAGPLDDTTFAPAAEVGNSVARQDRRSPVEDNNAARFGSLTTQPAEDQNVDGSSVHGTALWSVQFERDLRSQSVRDVQFRAGGRTFVAFGVWNGSIGDRDGQKSISVWNTLEIDP